MGECEKLPAASEREHESQIHAQVEEENHGKIVAIDLETGTFEVDASELAACDRELKDDNRAIGVVSNAQGDN